MSSTTCDIVGRFRPFCLRILLIAVLFSGLEIEAQGEVRWTGINLAGLEFGSAMPGKYGTDYISPTTEEIDYFHSRGMNIIRLPFRWERVQPKRAAALDPVEIGRIQKLVDHAASRKMSVILDMHNYARYYEGDEKHLIGSEEVPVSQYADVWARLAEVFKDDSHVLFGLMNEPHSMPTEDWVTAANGAILGIRETGSKHGILVSGNAWSGAHSWFSDWYGTPNAEAMLAIHDPADRFAFELHQYFDPDFSGSADHCDAAARALASIGPVTDWLRKHKRRAFMGEFGVPANEACLEALEQFLVLLDKNSDVWLGWTYWSAGPWMQSYQFAPWSSRHGARPQMEVLSRHAAEGDRM